MKQVCKVKDIYGNHYEVIKMENYQQYLSNPSEEFFGYVNKDERFICSQHLEKNNPQILFVISAKNK